MTDNRLKLNADKIQFMWLGSSYYTASVSQSAIAVGGTTVSTVDAVLNLGVTFDAQLTMRNHVDIVTAHYHRCLVFCFSHGDYSTIDFGFKLSLVHAVPSHMFLLFSLSDRQRTDTRS